MASIYDWQAVLDKAKQVIRSSTTAPSMVSLSRETNVPRSTLRDAFKRYGINDLQELYLSEQVSVATEEKINIKDDGDEKIVDVTSKRVKTLEQILAICKVDTSIWEVDHYIINKWEVGAKTTKKTLVFENGTITGKIDDTGELTIEPLYQIKVWLRRKVSIQDLNLQPVRIVFSNNENNSIKPTKTKNSKTAVVLSDIQCGFSKNHDTGELIPFHDRRAMDIAIQIISLIQPDEIIILGDSLDLSDFTTKFIRIPEYYWSTQSSLIELAWWFGKIRMAAPNANIQAMEGNHEKRLEDSVVINLSSAYHLFPVNQTNKLPALSVENLLSLQSLNIKYINGYPNNEIWLNDHIRCIHGKIVRSNPGGTAGKLVQESEVTSIQGHIHRLEMASRTIRRRDKYRTIHAFTPGCLCRIDGLVPGSDGKEHWQQGMGVIYYNENSHECSIAPVSIQNGTAIWHNQTIQGKNRVAELRRDTKWKQF